MKNLLLAGVSAVVLSASGAALAQAPAQALSPVGQSQAQAAAVPAAGAPVSASTLDQNLRPTGPAGIQPTKPESGWLATISPSSDTFGLAESRMNLMRAISRNPSALNLGALRDAMPEKGMDIWPAVSLRGYYRATQGGTYQFRPVIESGNGLAVPTKCQIRLDAIELENRFPLTQVQPVLFRAQIPDSFAYPSQPVDVPGPGFYELELQALCHPWKANAGQPWNDAYDRQSVFKTLAADRLFDALPSLRLEVMRPGEETFSAIRADEIAFDRAAEKSLSVLGTGTSGASSLTLGARRSVADALPHLADKLKETKPGWFIDVHSNRGDKMDRTTLLGTQFDVAPNVIVMGGHEGSTSYQQTRLGMANPTDASQVRYVANTRFIAPTAGDYTFAWTASSPANVSGTGRHEGRCDLDVEITTTKNDWTLVKGNERPIVAGDAGQLKPVWIGSVRLEPGVYALKMLPKCSANGTVRLSGYVSGPDDAALRPLSANDVRYLPGTNNQ